MSVDYDRLIKQKLTNIASYVEEITPYLQVPVKGISKIQGGGGSSSACLKSS